MDFALTEEERAIRDAARDFAAARLAPNAARLDVGEGRDEHLANLRDLAGLGFMALCADPDHGGAGATSVSYALAIEEIAHACASTATTVSVTNLAAAVISARGTPAQKAEHVARIASGAHRAASFCLTEADAGSDPAAMRMSARREGGHFVLSGEKLYITSAPIAGVFVVFAKTDPAAPRGKGISCFLVDAKTPGVVVGRPENKMGQRGSETATVRFEDARVPAEALVGEEHDGFRIAVGELAGGRIGIAALSIGVARRAVEMARAYMLERRQFGSRLADMQGLQWMLADRLVEIEASRLLTLAAAARKDRGEPYAVAASMAKLHASEAAGRAADFAVQAFGGAGYIRETGVERLARDVRLARIYEGTSEIQRLVIARDALSEG